MKTGMFILFAIFLSACASSGIDPALCGKANWEKVGQVDGREGRPQTYKDEHAKSCGTPEAVDAAAYDRGWDKGRLDYCTPANTYDLGLMGRRYSPICPKEIEASLLEAHAKGRELQLKKSELAEVEKKIADEKERREKDESVLNHVSQAYHLLSGTSPTQDMENRAAKIQDEVNRMEVSAPPRISTPASELGWRQGLDTLGALVGTVVGFGSGHAIQGRYKTDGWKWTVGEVGTIAAMVAVSRSECPANDRPSGDVNTEPARCASDWPAATTLVWLGFRIWQSVDLFGYESHSRYALGVTPQGLQLVYNF